MCTEAFPRYRDLPNLRCDSWRSLTSVSLLSLFHGNDVKTFETAGIEDDAGTKMGKRWCTFRQNIMQMVGQVGWPFVLRVEASFFGKVDSKLLAV